MSAYLMVYFKDADHSHFNEGVTKAQFLDTQASWYHPDHQKGSGAYRCYLENRYGILS